MHQTALSLFESAREGSPGVIALGPNARADLQEAASTKSTEAGSEVLLGTLVWFSVSNAVRLTPESLKNAMEVASLDPIRLAPRAPTPEAALTRAAGAAEVKGARLATDRRGEPVEEKLYASVLARGADRGVKQLVTEILDAADNRLSYSPVAAASLENGTLVVETLAETGLLPVEAGAISALRRCFAFEKTRHDGEGVRRVLGRALSAANAIPLRNSGGMYFVPRDGGEGKGWAARLLAFVEEVRIRAESAPTKTPRPSRAMSVPLVDRQEYREVLAESLEEHVEKEAGSLIKEMSALLKGDAGITEKRGRGFVERVRSLKESVAAYEELLEMRATEARTNLEAAMQQARGLLGRVEG